ncbi:hypothetical protein [Nocardia sp. NPDC003183]
MQPTRAQLHFAPVLADLWQIAEKQGWATWVGAIEDLVAASTILAWEEVPNRRGEENLSELRPVTAQQAPSRSLSAVYGLGAQPLHTDGAHLRQPPDVVILAAPQPNSTPTKLWKPQYPCEEFEHGLFTVDAGTDTFLATAYDVEVGRWRYDPGCMRPADERAHTAIQTMNRAFDGSVTFEWSLPNQVLLIDNRAVLHARSEVADGDHDRVMVRAAFRLKRKP